MNEIFVKFLVALSGGGSIIHSAVTFRSLNSNGCREVSLVMNIDGDSAVPPLSAGTKVDSHCLARDGKAYDGSRTKLTLNFDGPHLFMKNKW